MATRCATVSHRLGTTSLFAAVHFVDDAEPLLDPIERNDVGIDATDPFPGMTTSVIGGMWPQAALTRFAEPGLFAQARHCQGKRPIGVWVGLGGLFSEYKDAMVTVRTRSGVELDARQNTTQWAIFTHVGAELQSYSDNAFFRPRLSIGPGFYVFVEDVDLVFAPDFPWDDSMVYDLETLTLGRFGWQSIIGADFFFTPKWGISVDLRHDRVLHLDQRQGSSSEDVNARFTSVAVGVAVPDDPFR